jgi:hypothetical protein
VARKFRYAVAKPTAAVMSPKTAITIAISAISLNFDNGSTLRKLCLYKMLYFPTVYQRSKALTLLATYKCALQPYQASGKCSTLESSPGALKTTIALA